MERIVGSEKDVAEMLGTYLGDPKLGSFFADAIETIKLKGVDYGKDGDRLANFRKNAHELGLAMRTVWRVFFSKSLDSITNYCARGKVESEPIRKRLVDAVNYLALLDLIVQDPEGGEEE